MANIARFNPFGELARFDPFHEFDDMFRVPRSLLRRMPEEPQIRMDVTEDEKAYHVKAEIPGVRKEDVKVSIDGDQVSIGAEVRKEKEEKKGETIIRSERYYGNQFRGFTVAQQIDSTKAEARYENGILELTLPKKEPGSAKQIAVK
ncbi:MAG TPA: Hsp20/alpha crystallin family protein [Casimicrobiaceae bacterium]|nr:Hsp20/alpha crystallin family protein [Casimicrobiaceae bacterium]